MFASLAVPQNWRLNNVVPPIVAIGTVPKVYIQCINAVFCFKINPRTMENPIAPKTTTVDGTSAKAEDASRANTIIVDSADASHR